MRKLKLKLSKKTKRDIKLLMFVAYNFFALGYVVYGLANFFAGWHNIDLYQNFMYLELEVGFRFGDYNLTEHNIYGEPMSLGGMYINGVIMLFKGLFFVVMGMILWTLLVEDSFRMYKWKLERRDGKR